MRSVLVVTWEGTWALGLRRDGPAGGKVPGSGETLGWAVGPHGQWSLISPASCPPGHSQQHLPLSPGLFSAKMPGPAKPAVPVGHPRTPPHHTTTTTILPLPCSGSREAGPSPRARAVSRRVEGMLRLENRMPQLLPHLSASCQPDLSAYPCSFFLPPP